MRGGGILGIELRRSAAPWAGALFLVGAAAFLYTLSGPWWKSTTAMTAQWTSAAQWERFLLLFLWPLVVGAGAVQGMREHRAAMTELLGTTPRPAHSRVARTAGSLAIGLVAGYLLLFLHNAAGVIANGGAFHLGWLPIVLVGALAMVAGGLVGMGVGRTLPSPLTPPAAAVVALIAMMFLFTLEVRGGSGMPIRLSLLSPALPAVQDEFAVIAGRVHLGQAVWLAGLAVAGIVLLTAARARTRLLALPPVAFGAAVALAVLPSTPDAITTVNRTTAEQVCQGDVCLSRLHGARLADFAVAGAEALRLLSTMPDPPRMVREVPPVPLGGASPRAADAVHVVLRDRVFLAARTPEEITRALVAGAGTPACWDETRPGGDRVNREMAARTVAAAWFMGEYAPLPGGGAFRDEIDPLALPVWERLRALPEKEQRERVAALRLAALRCQGDLLGILDGLGAR